MANETPILLDDEKMNEEFYEQFRIVIDAKQSPIRIDKFLKNRIEYATRNKIQQAIEHGMVLVNNNTTTANYKIKPNDEIIIYNDEQKDESKIVAEQMALNIVFEDNDIIVINKPPGLVVHPGSGNYNGTLLNGIAFHLLNADKNITEENLPRYGLVHRIDKNTSGLLVLAKNIESLSHLAKQFFEHTIDRTYVSLVWGDMENDSGTIVAHVGRHKRFRKKFEAYPDGDYGKEAITHYKVVERFGYVTLINCRLETGRTHQIRVHMKYIEHPVFNDDTYGGDKIVKGTVFSKYKQFVENCFAICPRQVLHANTLGFIHPKTKEKMFFTAPIPDDIEQVIEKWRSYVRQIN